MGTLGAGSAGQEGYKIGGMSYRAGASIGAGLASGGYVSAAISRAISR